MRKRPLPKPIINALREEFRSVLDGEIEGKDVYLLVADAKGRSRHAFHYVASPDFMEAVRVCDSGIENFDTLCGEEGFELTLLSPSQRKLYDRRLGAVAALIVSPELPFQSVVDAACSGQRSQSLFSRWPP